MSSAQVEHLNDTHRNQVLAYLKFFQAKRVENGKELDATFEEQKDMRLLDDMYPLSAVSSLLDDLRSIIGAQSRDEHERLTNQSVLYLRQVFMQAEGNGVQILVDVNMLEDAVLLAGVEKLTLSSASSSSLPPSGRLNTLAPVGGAAVDVRLVGQIKDLQDSNRSLLAKFEKLQSQCASSLKEGVELKERNRRIQDELDQSQGDLANLQRGNNSAQQNEIDKLRSQLTAATEAQSASQARHAAEVKAAAEALGSKVNNAPQYQQLKKIMNTKNEQLKEARARVKVLEEHLESRGGN